MKKPNQNSHFKYIRYIIFVSVFSLSSLTANFAQFKVPKQEPEQIIFDFKDKEILFQPVFNYNRVQGPYLGVDLVIYLKQLWQFKLLGSLGYGFEDTRRYRAGIQRSFFDSNPLTIGLAFYDQVCSLDEWYIGNIENSLAALFFKEDFMDYFGKKGMLGFADQKLAEVHTIRIEVDQTEFQSLSRQTNWALFYQKKHFRENPPIIPETTTRLRFLWLLDWLDNPLAPISGWYLEGIGEGTYGDDVDTQGLFITLTRFQPTVGSHQLQMKLMVGARQGCDQRYGQYLMDMGGIGTLVGYKYKEFKNGNRFLYATAHYLFNRAVMGRRPMKYLPLSSQFTLGVFIESGWLYFGDKDSNPIDDFSSLNISDLKTDVGISLYVSDNLARIDFAKRTDRSKEAWRVTVRFMQRF